MTPTYGGQALFGYAVNCTMIPNANAAQLAAFFGVEGVQSMDGGGRGRAFEITGLMAGNSPAAVTAAGYQLEQFADGVARVFVDPTGTAWPNVVFRREFQWNGRFLPSPTVGGWVRQYRCVLHGLT